MKQGRTDNVYIFEERKEHVGLSQVIHVYALSEVILAKEQKSTSLILTASSPHIYEDGQHGLESHHTDLHSHHRHWAL